MALSEQQLAGILGNAKKLCNPEADRVMNEYRDINANQKKAAKNMKTTEHGKTLALMMSMLVVVVQDYHSRHHSNK